MSNDQRDVARTEATTWGNRTDAGSQERLNPRAANQAVLEKVTTWEGVEVSEHRFGGVEFRVGRREIGHLHASFADLPFPRRKRDELVAARRARPHHIYPDSGWVTVPMRTNEEVKNVIELLRENYMRATAVHERPALTLRLLSPSSPVKPRVKDR